MLPRTVQRCESLPVGNPNDSRLKQLLREAATGCKNAKSCLVEELEGELRRCAERHLRGQPPGHSVQATMLVDDTFMRLLGPRDEPWAGRTQFLAAAAKAMRRMLVDHARSRQRKKRGGELERCELDDVVVTYESRAYDLVALDDLLEKVAEYNPLGAQTVELRFFGGMSMKEIARHLGVPERTLDRNYQATKAMLHGELS